jgi:hypothetical protein
MLSFTRNFFGVVQEMVENATNGSVGDG